MAINWKVWAPLGIVVLAVLAIMWFPRSGERAPLSREAPQAPVERVAEQKEPTVAVSATGNIDDVVEALLADTTDDQALFASAEKDAALVAADGQVISDFGQSYNANDI